MANNALPAVRIIAPPAIAVSGEDRSISSGDGGGAVHLHDGQKPLPRLDPERRLTIRKLAEYGKFHGTLTPWRLRPALAAPAPSTALTCTR